MSTRSKRKLTKYCEPQLKRRKLNDEHDEWKCKRCTFINNNDLIRCTICNTIRPRNSNNNNNNDGDDGKNKNIKNKNKKNKNNDNEKEEYNDSNTKNRKKNNTSYIRMILEAVIINTNGERTEIEGITKQKITNYMRRNYGIGKGKKMNTYFEKAVDNGLKRGVLKRRNNKIKITELGKKENGEINISIKYDIKNEKHTDKQERTKQYKKYKYIKKNYSSYCYYNDELNENVIDSMSINVLKCNLKFRGLKIGGNSSELKNRLKEYLNNTDKPLYSDEDDYYYNDQELIDSKVRKSMLSKELKYNLKQRKLDTSGKKENLQNRLKQYLIDKNLMNKDREQIEKEEEEEFDKLIRSIYTTNLYSHCGDIDSFISYCKILEKLKKIYTNFNLSQIAIKHIAEYTVGDIAKCSNYIECKDEEEIVILNDDKWSWHSTSNHKYHTAKLSNNAIFYYKSHGNIILYFCEKCRLKLKSCPLNGCLAKDIERYFEGKKTICCNKKYCRIHNDDPYVTCFWCDNFTKKKKRKKNDIDEDKKECINCFGTCYHCGHFTCTQHLKQCRRCDSRYCPDCIGKSGFCEYCYGNLDIHHGDGCDCGLCFEY